jgi:hypothetical protein
MMAWMSRSETQMTGSVAADGVERRARGREDEVVGRVFRVEGGCCSQMGGREVSAELESKRREEG